MGLLDSMMDDPQSVGLLNAASQILQQSGNVRQPYSLGQAMGTGISGYMQGSAAARARKQQEEEQAQAMQMRQMQIEQAKREQAQQQQAMQEQARLRDFYTKTGMPQSGIPQGAPQLSGAPQQSIPGMQPAQQASQQGQSGESLYESMMQEARALQGAGFIQQAQAKMKEALSVRPKFATEARTVMGPDGKPMLIQMADDGTARPIQGGYGAAEQLHFGDNGQNLVGMDKYTGQVKSSLGKQQSLESIAGNNVAMRGQNMVDARTREQNAIGNDANSIKREEARAVKDMTKASQVASFDTMLGTLGRLGDHPGLSRSVGLMSKVPTMPGSESANFQAELDTFQSQAFIPMVAQLKGMGALSDAEGRKLTAAVGALSPSMGEKAFRDSVTRITNDMESARARVSGQPKQAGGASGDWDNGSKPAGGKVATLSDIAETARKSGRSTAEVTAALRAKGFTIGGQ